MKILHRPVPSTILFGLFCGTVFIPLSRVLNNMLGGGVATNLALWLFAAGYALLLSRWSRQKVLSVSYPLLFLLLTAFMVPSVAAFYLLTLTVIGWIRSGLCHRERRRIRLIVELLLGAAGVALVAICKPGSASDWALCIWLLFLLQGIYFAIFESDMPSSDIQSEQEVDPFELASRRAEDILSTPPAV